MNSIFMLRADWRDLMANLPLIIICNSDTESEYNRFISNFSLANMEYPMQIYIFLLIIGKLVKNIKCPIILITKCMRNTLLKQGTQYYYAYGQTRQHC